MNFKNFSTFKLSSLSTHMGAVLSIFTLLVFLMVGWVVYQEIRKFTGLSIDTSVVQSKTIRVNMEKYNELQKRFDDNAQFKPQPIDKAYVFSTPPETAPAP